MGRHIVLSDRATFFSLPFQFHFQKSSQTKSEKTSRLIGQLLESINKIEPLGTKQEGLFTQIMAESIEVQHSRIQRILNTSMGIPPIIAVVNVIERNELKVILP